MTEEAQAKAKAPKRHALDVAAERLRNARINMAKAVPALIHAGFNTSASQLNTIMQAVGEMEAKVAGVNAGAPVQTEMPAPLGKHLAPVDGDGQPATATATTQPSSATGPAAASTTSSDAGSSRETEDGDVLPQ